MDSGNDYEVKDMKLSEQGRLSIELAESRMAALLNIRERFAKEKPFAGLTVGMALHVTKETAVLVRTFVAGGAKVVITGCNPLSTQDDVAAALADEGRSGGGGGKEGGKGGKDGGTISVYAYKGETHEDYYRYLNKVIDAKPNITIDDGCDLVTEIHTKHPELIKSGAGIGLIGGCEETTTGILRLRAMEKEGALKYPIMAVNDNKTKHLLDNYYGTGQSTIDGIMRATAILFAGKNVVVCGYGDCGKGVSMRAKGLGASIVVTEVDAFRALQATLDGFRVLPIKEAAKIGDIFITVTGDKNVIDGEHIKLMKDGAILANSGHFDAEINVKFLEKEGRKRRMRPFLDEYTLGGSGGKGGAGAKRVYLCGEGRLVNLAAAEGHPSEVMSTSFCGQALACEYLVKNKGKLKAGVHKLPDELDDLIARLQLDAMGVRCDSLTDEQKKYLASWKEGT